MRRHVWRESINWPAVRLNTVESAHRAGISVTLSHSLSNMLACRIREQRSPKAGDWWARTWGDGDQGWLRLYERRRRLHFAASTTQEYSVYASYGNRTDYWLPAAVRMSASRVAVCLSRSATTLSITWANRCKAKTVQSPLSFTSMYDYVVYLTALGLPVVSGRLITNPCTGT